MSTERLRFGVLGAARIAPEVLVRPAALRADVDVIAIAARNEARARAFAVEHGIPTAYGSYEALLADPRIDAVYIALPTALHARYSITALAAGKHVLCEKPFAANALEAEAMVAAAASSGKVLAEAFHYYYHPFADEMRTLGSTHLTSRPVHVTASFFVPVDRPDDFRRNFELGGGAFLDLGCYPIHWVRTLLGEEPTVVSAEAAASGDIDEAMSARLAFPSGATGVVECSMARSCKFANSIRATAGDTRLMFSNPLIPHAGNSIRLTIGDERSMRTISGESSYRYQLAAFVEAIRGRAPMPTSGADSIANMRAIDGVYRAAGLRLRGYTSGPIVAM
jgi:predicted dehydrogenase